MTLRVFWVMFLSIALAIGQDREDQILKVDVDLVNVYCTVSDHKGRLVSKLRLEDFSVFEDGEPQRITHFSRETDVPLTVVLLIDTSGSVLDKLRFEKEAAANFLFATLNPDRDKAALVTFDHAFDIKQDYTNNPTVLAEAVSRIHAGGGTRLYDALYFVMQEKLSGVEERKVIVLITDGDDRFSQRSPQEVVDLAHRHDVSIYAISMNALGDKHSGTDRSDEALRVLSSSTGGIGFFPTKLEKLSANFTKIANELRSQYAIGYRSTNDRRDGTFRKIRIDLRKVQYSVRTRPGYYAPEQVLAKRN